MDIDRESNLLTQQGGMNVTNIIQVVTTTAAREDAERIAKELVEKRLAACAQVNGPITSYYWWEKKLECAQEWVCRIKTRKENYSSLEQAIRELHPYDVPEILATTVVAGNPQYLEWITTETISAKQ